jgi:hypothetical protein
MAKQTAKKPGKTIKERRAEKRAKAEATEEFLPKRKPGRA